MPNKITLYHNPRCSKSRAALQLLQQQKTGFDVVDYQKTPPDAATLTKILNLLDFKASQLLRQGEAQYKNLKADIENYSDAELIDLMVKYPILIERPLVITENDAAIGRPIDNIIELLDRNSIR